MSATQSDDRNESDKLLSCQLQLHNDILSFIRAHTSSHSATSDSELNELIAAPAKSLDCFDMVEMLKILFPRQIHSESHQHILTVCVFTSSAVPAAPYVCHRSAPDISALRLVFILSEWSFRRHH